MKKFSAIQPVSLIASAVLLLAFASATAASSTQVKTNRVIVRRIEALLQQEFHPHQPGGVAVAGGADLR